MPIDQIAALDAGAAPDGDFLMSEQALRRRRSTKWASFQPDILPAFVAEMDFKVAPAIQAAIKRAVDEQDYGYFHRPGGHGAPHPLAAAFSARMRDRYGWHAAAELARPVTDLVQGLNASVIAFSDAGQGVAIQSPIYPPIRSAVADNGRKIITLAMVDDGVRFAPDIERMQRELDGDSRLILLCHPHNPTGRVLTDDELLAIGRLAVERDLVVVSDEIHAELVYGGSRFRPFASLGPDIAARTVTLTSATKSFNIPGLRAGVMHFGSADLMRRFDARIPGRLMGSVNNLGIAATIAAWTDGEPWLRKAMEHLTAARTRTIAVLSKELPEIGVHSPDATYLLWLDCRKLGLNTPACEFFREQGKISLSAGETFEPGAEQFVRLNFATSLPILDSILERLVSAAKRGR